jgi:hypothetical protein
VTDEAGDLLDRHALVRKQRDEAVPQLARRPLGGIQACRGGDAAEPAPDVGGIERGAG